ncbi:MAG: HAMP domain-containing histidine kinase, partial [Candidatus Omnitrophica bacterium]|nr:HAMP domain-containing histidine kinase [Candidatus Omnitrophota bacterium]
KIQECLMDVLDIAQQMETLVTALLTIVREGETSAQVSNQETDLVDLVDKAHRSFSEIVTEKHLNVSLTTPENAVVNTDSNIALAILRNLFSNAFYYTPPEGSVECVVEKNGRGAEIRLTNTTADLEPSDLDQIFEPFWRKDAARSEEDRHGLGLSLVQRFSELLNVKVEASLPEEGKFQMKVRFAGDSESESKTRNSKPMTDS